MLLSSRGLYACWSNSSCLLHTACNRAGTTILGRSVTNVCSTHVSKPIIHKSLSPLSWNCPGSCHRLVYLRGFTVLAAKSGPETLTRTPPFLHNQSKCGHFGLYLLLKCVRKYHVTLPIYRRKEYVAGDQVRFAKMHPILKKRVVILIDQDGTNLGRMDSKVALGMAEGRGLKAEQVTTQRKGIDGSLDDKIPVFKMASGKALYEEKKAERKKARSSIEIIKEVHIGTKITDHDITNKLRYIVDVLEKGKSVRVFAEVRAKGKWMSSEIYEKELSKRSVILDDVEKHVKGIGLRGMDGKGKGNMVCALFRPTPVVLQRKAERLRELSESGKKKKNRQKEEVRVEEETEGEEQRVEGEEEVVEEEKKTES